nr:immunoglobulin heavy chain junction region [Mus musculus]MBK4183775.1 immunoglobulin heavy chain junction region [Mus musculus]MBK4183776.1 immunoglobulin heavy chain junction region [Mus musculus]MBK4183778.1 immunoglobulin heavy chain junction region [Mus musculus]MBK4183779.1 immunoglobulin heavy chain junction region [Mus musculus]
CTIEGWLLGYFDVW